MSNVALCTGEKEKRSEVVGDDCGKRRSGISSLKRSSRVVSGNEDVQDIKYHMFASSAVQTNASLK